MTEIHTNRDLYVFVAELTRRRAEGTVPPLARYLRRLHALALPERAGPGLVPTAFAALLDRAFDDGPSPPAASMESPAFAAWSTRIEQQIRDLDEMAAAGTLADEQRYFGVNAPSGARWYNFDPCTFVECATVGTFGGWEEGDDTGRAYVPGDVAVQGPAGEIEFVDPRDVDDPVFPLGGISWEVFVDFLDAGQTYE